MERAVVMSKKAEILPEELPVYEGIGKSQALNVEQTLKDAINEFKKEFITQTLKHTAGNKSKAAKKMGIQRSYLSRLISRYSLRDSEEAKRIMINPSW